MSLLCGKISCLVFLLVILAIDSSKAMGNPPLIMDNKMLTECLMELKMPELLRLQRSLERMPELEDAKPAESRESNLSLNDTAVCEASEPENNGTCVTPQALALYAEKRGYHHDYHPWQADEKPSKLQTLFSITITALAFLSFGGYLLCLIVQAIKSKGTTYIHPATGTATATALANANRGVKRIKIYRRSRREVLSGQTYHPSKANNPYSAHFY